ncbi:MAG: lipid A biosynthesis acyltransferase [Betaproteobacteria bacterium]|nr:lipid A biosynthesis acyltransferase [Betaproteobacteria bacterium]
MRAVLFILWCLRWLPPRWVSALGNGLGGLLFHWGRKRVTLINLKACFPEKSDDERERIGRGVFRNLARSTLELGRLWYAPLDVALANVKLIDRHLMDEWAGKVPIIVLAPHFVGLDIGGARFSREYPGAFSMYSEQKNKVFDKALRRSRQRYNDATLITRQQGLRPVLKALKEKRPFYYLPDMDFGAKDAVFVDFFGIKTATVTAMSRLCGITGAKVIPLITCQTGAGYEAQFYPAWENFPSGDVEADARRVNAFLEDRIREMPDQYFWVHKRFKTRPPGERNFYD